jgi:hypothetical protein
VLTLDVIILMENALDSSSYVLTLVTIFMYIFLIKVTCFVRTFFFSNVHLMTFLNFLSSAFSKSVNIICSFFFVPDISP